MYLIHATLCTMWDIRFLTRDQTHTALHWKIKSSTGYKGSPGHTSLNTEEATISTEFPLVISLVVG